MEYYSGLDVSLETTFVSIIDEQGQRVREGVVDSRAESLRDYLAQGGESYAAIGIESGQLSIALC